MLIIMHDNFMKVYEAIHLVDIMYYEISIHIDD